MKKINVFLFLIICLLALTSCNPTEFNEDKSYTVHFEENGGEDVEDITNIKKGSTIKLPDITKEGYIFKGWYTSKKFIKGTEVTEETLIGKDITLYANWTAIKYNLVINLDGGTWENLYFEGNNKVEYGTKVNLNNAQKTGYLFEGWFINNKEVFEEVIINGDTTLDAKWIDIKTLEKEYTVKLELNGGNLYQYSTKEELADDFIRDFSTFTDGNTDITNFWDHSYIYFIDGFLAQENYYNKWEFFLEYLASNASESLAPMINNYLKCNGEVNKFEENGVEFNTIRTVLRNEITAFFTNTQRVVSGWEEITSADYSQKELQVGYLEYCKMDVPNVYETGKGLKLPEPVKEGYIFLGWYDNPELTGNIYEEVSNNEYGNRVFYAKYGKIE